MKNMTHKNYLKTNELVSKVAKKYGATWAKQYSYFGLKSRRTKLWDIQKLSNLSQREMAEDLCKIPNVLSVEFTDARRTGHNYIFMPSLVVNYV